VVNIQREGKKKLLVRLRTHLSLFLFQKGWPKLMCDINLPWRQQLIMISLLSILWETSPKDYVAFNECRSETLKALICWAGEYRVSRSFFSMRNLTLASHEGISSKNNIFCAYTRRYTENEFFFFYTKVWFKKTRITCGAIIQNLTICSALGSTGNQPSAATCRRLDGRSRPRPENHTNWIPPAECWRRN